MVFHALSEHPPPLGCPLRRRRRPQHHPPPPNATRTSASSASSPPSASSSGAMRILVTGASGFAGSLLVPRLLSEGHAVRALGRDPARVTAALAGAFPGGAAGVSSEVEVLRGDALTGEGLARALARVDVAYYLIHSMERRSPPQGSFAQRERLALGEGALGG